MSSLADEGIIRDFVTESREHLGSIEPDLLKMEAEGDRASNEVINRVFRAIHSIKGGAGFFAFERLKTLSHAMESVLMQVRDRKLSVSAEVMDVVFAALDRLRTMLDDIQESESVPCETEMTALKRILEGQGVQYGAQLKAKTQGGAEFNLDAEDVRAAVRRGMVLYHAQAYLHRDIRDQGMTPLTWLANAQSVGVCLDAFIDLSTLADLGGCLAQDVPVTLLVGTVLEPDLAALGLKLPATQLKPLDMVSLKQQLSVGKTAPAPAAPVAKAAKVPAPAPAESAPEDRGARNAKEAGAETLRVRVDLLTNLMNLAGELVLGRNQLLRAVGPHSRGIQGLPAILQNINQVTSDMQEGIMQTRMQPIGSVFTRFPRIIRDMARQLGKQIEVQILGAEVELDKSIVELLVDPLTHIIRNCADHALETPEVRLAAGKPATGTIVLNAFHEGGQVNITIRDDGRGIDGRKVLEKAIAKGLVSQAQASEMSEREMVNLIFAPGFSTAEQVSDISGRGVGMDVVRTNTEKLGGHVTVDTAVGVGTTVRLQLPLTLAIIPSMIVGVGEQRFAFPQVSVVEFVWVKAADARNRVERVQGAEVLRLRDQLLPLVRLSSVLDIQPSYRCPETGEDRPERRVSLVDRRGPAPEAEEDRSDRRQDWRSDYNIVVLRNGPFQFGVVVDDLYDIEEIVVKPLSAYLQDTKCFSGATILGDGRVVMILDAAGLAGLADLHFSDFQGKAAETNEELDRRHAQNIRRRSVILFRGAEGEHFAVPQDKVQRLERITPADLSHMGEREYIQYRGEALPIIRLDKALDVSPIDVNAQEFFLVIPKPIPGQGSIPPSGILIGAILDALDLEVDLKPVDIQGVGLLGSAVVHEHLTLFLDPQAMVREFQGRSA